MLRLTLQTGRRRLGMFLGSFLAFFASAILAMAGGMMLEAALSTHPPVERYAAANVVVMGQQDVGPDGDVPLTERRRVPATLARKLAAVPGVHAAIADNGVPAAVNGHPVAAHGWSSARLTPYKLTSGHAPASSHEVVSGYRAKLGSRLTYISTDGPRTVTIVGTALPNHHVGDRTIFLTDSEVARLARHPGRVDAIGLVTAPGFDAARIRAEVGDDVAVFTGAKRSRAEVPQTGEDHTRLIAVAASFAGIGIFVALFVVAGTMSLSVQLREQEIGLLRAVAATPSQIRRMIGWEAALVALFGSAAGIWFGEKLGFELADGLVRHDIAPANFSVEASPLIAGAVIAGSVALALLSVLSASRRASRVPATRALADASVEPRALGPGRIVGGLIAIAAAVPLFGVAASTTNPATAAATSEMCAIFLVTAVGFLGPIVARIGAAFLRPILSTISPVGGFLASSNLAAQTRRFSSASTPIVLTVAMSCTLLFSTTTLDHAVNAQRDAGLKPDVVVSGPGGLPPAALGAVKSTPGVRSAIAVTSTSLGPSLGVGDETIPAQIVAGGQGGGVDVGVISGSLNRLHGNAIALGDRRARDAHAKVGDVVKVTRGDGTPTTAKVAAIYKRSLGFGEALVAPELVAGHTTSPLVGTIFVSSANPAAVATRLRGLEANYPGLSVRGSAALKSADDLDRETNRWLGPLFVTIIFIFTSIAVVNTLVMIAMRRGRELALLQLSGGTRRQVRSMARWEAAIIVAIGLGVGLAIAATALLPLSHALTGTLTPSVPAGQLGAILGVSALLAVVALSVPTRRALKTPAITAVGSAE